MFPALAGDIHLNHAGVAPLPGPVADAMRAYVDDWSWRGPQPWAYARANRLRELAAQLVGAASADEIAIVSNTSTGIAIVAAGLGRARDDGSGGAAPRGLGRGDVVVTTAVEFPANRYAWDDRVGDGLELVVVPAFDDAGRFVRDDDIVAAMRAAFSGRSGTRLLAISHVQFATGQRHDLARLCAEARRLGGLVSVDAIQSIGQMPFEAERWGVDFASADGHKWMLGPEGAGILYVRREHLERLRPPLVGWLGSAHPFDYDRYDATPHPSARRYEPGALPMAGVVGLAAAVDLLLEEGLESIERRIAERAGDLTERVRGAGCRVARLDQNVGPSSGIVAFEPPPGMSPTTLDERLRARGVHGVVRRGLCRLSPHFYNTSEQMERATEAVRAAVLAGE